MCNLGLARSWSLSKVKMDFNTNWEPWPALHGITCKSWNCSCSLRKRWAWSVKKVILQIFYCSSYRGPHDQGMPVSGSRQGGNDLRPAERGAYAALKDRGSKDPWSSIWCRLSISWRLCSQWGSPEVPPRKFLRNWNSQYAVGIYCELH